MISLEFDNLPEEIQDDVKQSICAGCEMYRKIGNEWKCVTRANQDFDSSRCIGGSDMLENFKNALDNFTQDWEGRFRSWSL